jgi:protein-S-isoprenylcysteine O-methyltransferase Ste14
MSLTPEFELGVWNAWIFMLYWILSNLLPVLLSGWLIDREVLKKGSGTEMLSETERKISYAVSLLPFVLFAYSIFLPLKVGTEWFFAGLIICLLGAIIMTAGMLNFFTTAVDKLVTGGIYRYSRHPIYFGMFLIFGGTVIACVSWVFLLITAVFIVLLSVSIGSEERSCLQRYGEAYREYMDRTPRWIGIPK